MFYNMSYIGKKINILVKIRLVEKGFIYRNLSGIHSNCKINSVNDTQKNLDLKEIRKHNT